MNCITHYCGLFWAETSSGVLTCFDSSPICLISRLDSGPVIWVVNFVSGMVAVIFGDGEFGIWDGEFDIWDGEFGICRGGDIWPK